MPFDISAHLSTTQRDVRNVEHHGQSAKDVVAARVYDTNAADLWEAVTNPVRITRWFAPVTGEFKLGGASKSRATPQARLATYPG